MIQLSGYFIHLIEDTYIYMGTILTSANMPWHVFIFCLAPKVSTYIGHPVGVGEGWWQISMLSRELIHYTVEK